MKIIFVYGAFENLGIEYMSAVLKQHGHQTDLAFDPMLFNDTFLSINSLHKFFSYEKILLKEIEKFNPDVVAFSVISSYYVWAKRIAYEIKKKLPRSHITFGGPHSSSLPEFVLSHNYIDSVILGEGEYALRDLVDMLSKKKKNYSIPGVYFRIGQSLIKNRFRPLIENLDELPFPDKNLFYEKIPYFSKGYTLITRRGCLNKCTYCHNSSSHKSYPGQSQIRFRSVDNVMTELIVAKKKYNYQRLRINDDMFTANSDWLVEFSKQYKKHIDVPTYCYGTPTMMTDKTLRCLKDIKCHQISVGVQTINDNLRKNVLHRKETNEDIIRTINLCRQYGIFCALNNIIGLPGETENEILELAKFYAHNKPPRITTYSLVFYPGTKITEIAREKGLLDDQQMDKLIESPEAISNTLASKFHNRMLYKYKWLLLLSRLLPKRVGLFIIKKRIFKYFFPISPELFTFPFGLFNNSGYDIPRLRYVARYTKYFFAILWNKMNIFKKK